MQPVQAKRVRELNTLEDTTPGAFEVSASGKWILCVCPCGCGSMMNLPICQGEKRDGSWLWDGNRDAPTLAPSIRDIGGCKFHGHLRAGSWTFEGDTGK